MFSFRFFALLLVIALFLGGDFLSAQILSPPSPQTVQPQRFPTQQGPLPQQGPVPQQPIQVQQPIQAQPMQVQPMQMQPVQMSSFGTQGNPSVYRQTPPSVPPQQFLPVAQPAVPATPLAAPVGTMPVGQPIRVATANPPTSVGQPGAVVPGPPPVMMPHAARIVPFTLSPAEQQELDEFLARWERCSAGIKQYEVDFNMFLYDPTVPDANPEIAQKTTFGYFKYIANPMRFVYEVEGEWQGDKRVKRSGDKNPNIYAEKVIIDEKTVYKYDFVTKTMIKINVPPEMIGKGIADSPLPLIFGARADELKRRFSMKIVPAPGQLDRIWLQARPLLPEDQQEFKELEILLDRKTLMAIGLRQWDINGKGHKTFEFRSPKVYSHIPDVMGILRQWFTPTLERGWKEEVVDWAVAQPSPASVMPPIGQPPSPPRHEIPLYQAQ